MLETAAELVELQRLLDASARSAGAFLRETFEIPDKTPTAEVLTGYLQGQFSLAIATVTGHCEPRVAPVTALFVHGKFWIPTERHSIRVRQLRTNSAVSITHWVNDVSAVIAHGRATVVTAEDFDFTEVDALHTAKWWDPLRRQQRGVYIRVDADRLYAWRGPKWQSSLPPFA